VNRAISDRQYELGTSFFLSDIFIQGEVLHYQGGSPVLYEHLFWFLGHPEVYIVILPAMGIVSEVMSVNARKPIFGYRAMIASILAIAFLSTIVWGHHMFVSGMNPFLGSVFTFTTLLIAIIIVAILGTGLLNSMWAITLALIPQFIHNTRDIIRREFEKEYVTAARLDGASRARILLRSVFPNMIEMLVVQATMALSVAILDISALGFLSLGAQSPSPELGAMLSDALETAYMAPWTIALPGGTIFLMVLSINLVGDGLRTALRNRLNQ